MKTSFMIDAWNLLIVDREMFSFSLLTSFSLSSLARWCEWINSYGTEWRDLLLFFSLLPWKRIFWLLQKNTSSKLSSLLRKIIPFIVENFPSHCLLTIQFVYVHSPHDFHINQPLFASFSPLFFLFIALKINDLKSCLIDDNKREKNR